MSLAETIAENRSAVRRRIVAACERADRDPTGVTLVAVTKYARLEWVRELVRQGEIELGESRPQQLVARAAELSEPVRWHLIGSLQRNKVRIVLPAAALVHSVDSLKLLETIDRIAGELNLRTRVLLEVNLSGEAAKHGFTRTELLDSWEQATQSRHTQIEGLMTMAPDAPDPEAARPVFAGLKELRDELRSCSSSPETALPHLSMGMSGDFEVAIEEGATFIRIGSALWENLE
jgi:PLP dependent protein